MASNANGNCGDKSVDTSVLPTTTATIKPGGEDNDPMQPIRSVSPSPPPPKVSSHRKMSQKTRLSNPLDAFDKSPESQSKGSVKISLEKSETAGGDNSNLYGYEDAAPTKKKLSPGPPMSNSAGAARAPLRRGVPAAGAKGLSKGPPLSSSSQSNTGGPVRRMPQRGVLKKASSFNVGDRKKHLKSALRHSSHGTSTSAANNEQQQQQKEPSRGVMRRASMGCTRTTTIEVRVRGERFPVQRRRSINFEQRVEIKEVEPVPEMVPGEEIWLQEEDFIKMKQDRRNLVQQVKKKHQLQKQQHQPEGSSPQTILSPEEASQMRGLEKYVDKSIRAAKNLAWDTVLLEQDEQELAGEYNDERIADLYRHFTKESPARAQVRAKQDEEEIQDYLWSPRTTKLMLRRLPTPSSVGDAANNPPPVTVPLDG